MTLESTQVWPPLVEVSKRGFPNWRSDTSRMFYGDTPDSRMDVPNYIAMSGNQRFWNSGDYGKFRITDIVRCGDGHYETKKGVITGTLGLLQLVDKFKFQHTNPSKLLLIGAITDKSLMCTLEFIKQKNWRTEADLVDLSEVPLRHIAELNIQGFFDGSPKFSLLQDSIQKLGTRKYDIIIGDILNVWAVPRFSRKSEKPFDDFESILLSSKSRLTKRGIFYSRCVVYPIGSSNRDINTRFDVKGQALTVHKQLSGLDGNVSFQFIEDCLHRLFVNATPKDCCGLDAVIPEFAEHPTLEGDNAEKQMIKLHKRLFREVDMIKILDLKSRAIYLNFACRN